MRTTSEHKFKAGYLETLEEARDSTGESLGLDGSVCEARVLDHSGRISETLERETK